MTRQGAVVQERGPHGGSPGDRAWMDDLDRGLIRETQAGLPLVPMPYHALAERLGTSAQDVRTRLGRMIERGVIRRIGAVPNHYTLGYRANGMTVWDVPDELVREAGREIGALDFVSHCYLRPRRLPRWPYNLFAMVHGHSRDEVLRKTECIEELLGDRQQGHEVLFSSGILKKTGLRIG